MKLGVAALCECALETGDAIFVCFFEWETPFVTPHALESGHTEGQ